MANAVVFLSVTCEPEVSLLTGSDRLWKAMPNNSEVHWVSDNTALIAINTKMEWTLQATSPIEEQGGQCSYSNCHICVLRTDVYEKKDFSYSSQHNSELDTSGIAR